MVIPRTAQYPRAVLFDLDGTLVDPADGITDGIRRALVEHGLTAPSQEVLDALVGPPLALGLRDLAGVTEANIGAIISSYRSWYAHEGMGRSRVYPGIKESLAELKNAGTLLALTTSKPQAMAQRLLALHGLAEYFAVVVGTSDDELAAPAPGGSKEHLVREALASLEVDAASAAVVGDRKFDILAARATGARAVGAAWGFAPEHELADAGAAVEVLDPAFLLSALMITEDA